MQQGILLQEGTSIVETFKVVDMCVRMRGGTYSTHSIRNRTWTLRLAMSFLAGNCGLSHDGTALCDYLSWRRGITVKISNCKLRERTSDVSVRKRKVLAITDFPRLSAVSAIMGSCIRDRNSRHRSQALEMLADRANVALRARLSSRVRLSNR